MYSDKTHTAGYDVPIKTNRETLKLTSVGCYILENWVDTYHWVYIFCGAQISLIPITDTIRSWDKLTFQANQSYI